jgi:hypothetical protein
MNLQISAKPIIVAALLMITALFVGCGKKDGGGSSNSDYYIKFKIDGKQITFKGYPYASFSQSDGMYMGGFGAFEKENVGTKNVASVLVGSLSEIKEGTYSGLINPPSGGATPAVFLTYIDDNGKTFGNLYQDNATNTVTITSLNGTSVKGNFSGKIYDVAQAGSSPLEFSGEFSVKRTN